MKEDLLSVTRQAVRPSPHSTGFHFATLRRARRGIDSRHPQIELCTNYRISKLEKKKGAFVKIG